MFILRVRSWLLTLVMLAVPALSPGQISISVTFAPPALPVYEQPLCPGEGYLWTPGYWAYDADDYYWVPGTWVLPPQPGLFWTPGYWAWRDGGFFFYDGFWAPQVGFYGGINYGYGYFGEGYVGGRWDHERFYYNRAVNNVNVTNIRNVYNTTVVNTTVTRVSYNGGNGGVAARPREQDEVVARERHIPPVAAQAEHVQAARSSRELRAEANHGRPPVAATPKPGALRDREVVAAREAGAPYNPERNRAATPGNATPGNTPRPGENAARPQEGDRGRPAMHANDIPAGRQGARPSTGDAKADGKYQQQEEKMRAQQDRDLQKLQRKQDAEHKKMTEQHANDAKMQQLEQRHQQQTQRLQQKNEQRQQKMERKMPPNRPQSGPGDEKH